MRARLFFRSCAVIPLLCVATYAADWAPIEPAELALAEPKLDPDADAETVFWRVEVADALRGEAFQVVAHHYIRIKIFNQRGVESESTVDLEIDLKEDITDLAGRTIKPDGSVIDLSRDAVFDRILAKGEGVRKKVKSFSLPNVEPGDVIEYQWRQYHDNTVSQYLRYYVQRETPAWSVVYRIKPSKRLMEYGGYFFDTRTFNAEYNRTTQVLGEYTVTTLSDVPAFKPEPRMPPEDHVRGWLLAYYTTAGDTKTEKYWKDFGSEIHNQTKDWMKVDDAVKEAAARVTAEVKTDEEKVAAIRKFVLTEIDNIDHDRSRLTAEQKDALEENEKPADTLAKKAGTTRDVQMLFGALARAAGLDARPVMLSGRDTIFFNPELRNPYFLNRMNMAVRIGEVWRFFDVANPYLPAGMLSWPQEGVTALVSDPKNPEWVDTPLAAPELSQSHRRASFTVLPDGAIEGTVRVTLSGHLANRNKNLLDEQTPEERQTFIREALNRRLSAAQIENIEVLHATGVDQPLVYQYKVRIPGYGQMTGKRIFLQPNFFEVNVDPIFTSSERRHDIYFEYAWSEDDEIVFTLPDGYELEEAASPGAMKFANVGGYEAMLFKAPGKLIYRRRFHFGANQGIIFPAAAYPQIKQIFDSVHQQDGQLLTLRTADAAGE